MKVGDLVALNKKALYNYYKNYPKNLVDRFIKENESYFPGKIVNIYTNNLIDVLLTNRCLICLHKNVFFPYIKNFIPLNNYLC